MVSVQKNFGQQFYFDRNAAAAAVCAIVCECAYIRFRGFVYRRRTGRLKNHANLFHFIFFPPCDHVFMQICANISATDNKKNL